MISTERKEELITVIRQQEENWANTYSGFDAGRIKASRELIFSEPLSFCVDGRTYCLKKATLKVTSGRGANSRVRFYPMENVWSPPADASRDPDLLPEEGPWSYLADVVRDSEITEEADIAIGMALSFLGNELSHRMMDNLRSSPTNDMLINLLSRFLR